MARGITLACVEDPDLELQVEEDESSEGTPGLIFTVGDSDDGVLLTDFKVNAMIEWLEEWRIRQAGSKGES